MFSAQNSQGIALLSKSIVVQACLVVFFLVLSTHALGEVLPTKPTLSQSPKQQRVPSVSLTDAIPLDSLGFSRFFYDLFVAEIDLQRGDIDSALTSYLNLSRATQDDQIVRYTTQIALEYGRMDIALEAAHSWLEISPNQYEARRIAATLSLINADVEQAAEHFIVLLESFDGEERAVTSAVIEILSREPKNAFALDVATLLAQRFQDQAAFWRLATELALEQNKPAQAEQFLARSIALGAEHRWAEEVRCNLLLSAGNKGAAVLRYRFLVATAPEDLKLRENYARFLVRARLVRPAKEEFEFLLAAQPENPFYSYSVALFSFELDEADVALPIFKRLYTLGFRTSDVAYFIGQIYEQKKQLSAASQWYSNVHSGEFQLAAGMNRTRLCYKKDRFECASDIFITLRQDFPDLALDLYLVEVGALQQIKAWKKAFDIVNQAIDEFPEDSVFLYSRAMLFNDTNQLDELEKDLLEVIRRDENNGVALNALGYTLADQTTRYQEAYAYLQRAIKIRPDDPAVIDSMGWVLFKLGELEKAEKWLQKAYAAAPSPEIIYHFARVLHDLQRFKEACQLVEQGLSMNARHAGLIRLQQQCQRQLK